MIPRKISLVGLIILIALLFQDCIREEFHWGYQIGEITYSRNAVFLNSEELSLLKKSTSDSMIFSGLTSELKKITTNSILVTGVSDSTPFGLLRKVTKVDVIDSSVIVLYKDAVLTDAIMEGTVRLHEKLLEKDFRLKSKVEGVLVEGPSKSFDGLAITLDNFEIFHNGTAVAKLNGSIGISPEIDMTIEIEAGEIKRVDLSTTLNRIDELTLSSGSAFSGNNEIIGAEFIHCPIVINDLVFVPEIKISCGFSGMAAGGVSSGVRQDRVITSNISFENGAWSEAPMIHTESYDFSRPQVTDNSDLKIFSGIDISMKLFNTPVQTIKSVGYYALKAEKTSSPMWKLYTGSEGTDTVSAEILGLAKGCSSEMVIEESEIASADGN